VARRREGAPAGFLRARYQGPDTKGCYGRIIEASIGSAQRIAMRVVDVPQSQREAAFKIVRAISRMRLSGTATITSKATLGLPHK
jgi:hypothetical protein